MQPVVMELRRRRADVLYVGDPSPGSAFGCIPTAHMEPAYLSPMMAILPPPVAGSLPR